MYADTITDSMRVALDETNRRREIQMKYNEEHGITPTTIKKSVRDLIAISKVIAKEEMRFEKDPESMSRKELEKLIADVQKKMQKAAADLNFEAAAELRDKIDSKRAEAAQLDEEIAAEETRALEIEALGKEVQTKGYIENVAREKLGLVYEDEILFKQDK